MPQTGPLLSLSLSLMFTLGCILFFVINFFYKLPIKTETFTPTSTTPSKPLKTMASLFFHFWTTLKYSFT